MKRLEDLLLQQGAAMEVQIPPPPAPVDNVAPRAPSPTPGSSRAAPVVAPREEEFAAPPIQVPPAGAIFPVMVEGAEQDRLMDRLNEFRRAVYRYGSDGCTGTAIDLGHFSANPRLGLGVFVGGVPVRGPVYRYAVQILSSLNCRGFFAIVGFYLYHPRP
uniref:Uncharacterized protein n=1 Tax=Ananas comosus var. bracteatus TaxID=296719 RepID=A0A6V7Q933_ANACO|nr:unnamed protein product [Ananas comosus var. bracteatus]